MNQEERSQAIFGAFDGVVSIAGFIFGLLIHGSALGAIAIGGLGGAVSATISMSTGSFESAVGTLRHRLRDAVSMGVATLVGSMVPIWPFFAFQRTNALIAAGIGCLFVATWIGKERHAGVKGYVTAYLTLVGAAGRSLLVVAAIPNSIG